jgi:hypothetical protein
MLLIIRTHTHTHTPAHPHAQTHSRHQDLIIIIYTDKKKRLTYPGEEACPWQHQRSWDPRGYTRGCRLPGRHPSRTRWGVRCGVCQICRRKFPARPNILKSQCPSTIYKAIILTFQKFFCACPSHVCPLPRHTSPMPKMMKESTISCQPECRIMLRTIVCESTAWSRG